MSFDYDFTPQEHYINYIGFILFISSIKEISGFFLPKLSYLSNEVSLL